MSKTYTHLTYEQRCQIYTLNKRGIKQEKIAREIEVSQPTVSRELQRNKGKRGYRYKQANKKAQQRRLEALDLRHRKIDGETKKFIIKHIKLKWSPEQISGSLARNGIKISHELIYLFVYKDKKKGGSLHTNLRRKGKKYQKRGAKMYAGRGYIPNRVDISERPLIVDKKKRFGDLEVDIVEGTKKGKAVLVTIVERKTQLL